MLYSELSLGLIWLLCQTINTLLVILPNFSTLAGRNRTSYLCVCFGNFSAYSFFQWSFPNLECFSHMLAQVKVFSFTSTVLSSLLFYPTNSSCSGFLKIQYCHINLNWVSRTLFCCSVFVLWVENSVKVHVICFHILTYPCLHCLLSKVCKDHFTQFVCFYRYLIWRVNQFLYSIITRFGSLHETSSLKHRHWLF